jgi:hypothetical protein
MVNGGIYNLLPNKVVYSPHFLMASCIIIVIIMIIITTVFIIRTIPGFELTSLFVRACQSELLYYM